MNESTCPTISASSNRTIVKDLACSRSWTSYAHSGSSGLLPAWIMAQATYSAAWSQAMPLIIASAGAFTWSGVSLASPAKTS